MASNRAMSRRSVISEASSEGSSHFFGRSRNIMKPGRLKRKNFKPLSGLYEKLSFEAFDEEIKESTNVIDKKKKILKFINKLESEGFLKQEELAKVIMMAKKLKKKKNQKIRKPMKRTPHYEDDIFIDDERDASCVLQKK